MEVKLKIGFKLFLFLSVSMFLASLSFYVLHRYSHERSLEIFTEKRVKQAEDMVGNFKEQDTRMMSATLEVIMNDQEFKNLFLKRDRDGLYNYGRPLFEDIRGKYGITHFYFHLPDGINFVRLHEKEIYGDKIERITFKKAVASRQFSSGIELGKTAFALRVVAPWYNNGELIGYVELGQEIDHFLRMLKGKVNDYFIMAADKNYLNRDDWKSMRSVAGLSDNWDELGDHVWFNWTTGVPNSSECFTEKNINRIKKGEFLLKEFVKSRNGFVCGGFPINDVEEKQVGVVMSLIDVSEQTALAERSERNIVIVFLLLFVLATLLLNLSVKAVIISPIERLAAAAKAIASGDLTGRVEVRTGDEIGMLSSTMNEMAERLHGLYSDMERKVAEKTYELHAANEELTATNEELQAAYQQLEAGSSDLEEANTQLAKANDELKDMDRLKTEFLQTISNELRTPITPVLGYLEMLRDGDVGELSPSQKEIIEEMHICGKNMQLLVDELLEVASIQAGKLYIECEDVDVCHILRDSIKGIRKYADDNKTELEVRMPQSPVIIEGDRIRLSEIFTHILRNAVKFNHEGGNVLIEASAEGKGVEIAISDTGIGISKEKLERIFDAFYQTESSTVRRYVGVGLGLYLVKRLVDVHNGRIDVKSEVGVGTTFTIFIPKKRSMGTLGGQQNEA